MTGRFSLRAALLGLLLGALLIAGCGSSANGEGDGTHPDYESALAGAPAPLAQLHAQENELIAGGIDAYEKRIASLRGYPVVANLWASWCGPCRFEFPAFQRLSARYGKKVAFVGIDSEDSDDAASTFLSEEPVPYPSYTDPDKEIFDSLGARGFPDTAFYDRAGNLCYLKQGPYTDDADLEADIKTYALQQGQCETG
ncbi:MAG TPA: TlpA disulfide reductase family protein [Solirubrobacterales bacterium]|nr:TlpA disulfide reductase family protein [Solirubrobacterales bacterium]